MTENSALNLTGMSPIVLGRPVTGAGPIHVPEVSDYLSNTNPAKFNTYSSTISVYREHQNYPGLVEIEITDDDFDGCGTPAFASISLDTTLIDGLIEALQAAKKLAEIGLDEYNYGKR